jgi:N-methylhydantoinase A
VPGPACYGRGGEAPTITDCNLVLGYLGEDNFLGGRMRLDAAKARAAIEAAVAKPLGLDVAEAAEGIVRVIDVKMEEAIKAISTMRGHDLRDFMLLAFGGAGPVHAGRMARELGMAGVIVPLYPGVYSAIGLIMSDVKHDYVQSRMQPIAELTPADVNKMFDRLDALALEELRHDGFAAGQIRIQRALDMRYAGQGYEITMPCGEGAIATDGLSKLRRRFDAQHQTMFGHMAPEEPVEVVSYRVRGIGLVPPVEMPKFKRAGTTLLDARRELRQVRFDGRDVECPVYQRERLDVGLTLTGPAILDQFDCTTVIYAGQVARVDEWKNLIVTQES